MAFDVGAMIGLVTAAGSSALNAAWSGLQKLAEFVGEMLSKLVDYAERFVRWYLNLWATRPFDALALTLVVAYWLTPQV